MPIDIFRVDDRLVHGQVAGAWTQMLRLNRILLVDEEIARDHFISKILTMMAPKGTVVEVHGLENGILAIQEARNQEDLHTMVLLKNPLTARKLADRGVTIPALCIGGMQRRQDRTPLTRTQHASEEEREALCRLQERGVSIYEQSLPSMDAVPLEDYL